MCLQFGFVIFWRKDFGAKAAHKMLVKLTPEWSPLQDSTLMVGSQTCRQILDIGKHSSLLQYVKKVL
jgi:hypothetical protein